MTAANVTTINDDELLELDYLTILRTGRPVGKKLTLQKDGSYKKSDHPHAATWEVERRGFYDIKSLARGLRTAGASAERILIHGAPLPSTDRYATRRRGEFFHDVAKHFVAIDVDKMEAPWSDPAKCAALARSLLPQEFHAAACVWHATAGHMLERGAARLRIFFLTDKPIFPAQAGMWAASGDLKIDMSIYTATQPIFLSVDMVGGARDPVPQRWGILPGSDFVAVPTTLPTIAAPESLKRGLPAADDLEPNAPHMIRDGIRRLAERSGIYDAVDKKGTALTTPRVEKDGRRNSFRLAAQDFHDLGVEESVAVAILDVWREPSMDGVTGLDAVLADAGIDFETSQKLSDALIAIAADERLRAVMNGGAEFLDRAHVEDQVEQGYSGARNHFGALYVSQENLDAQAAALAVRDDDDEQTPPTPKKARTRSLRDLLSAGPVAPDWIVKGVIPTNVCAVLWGAPGSLKTTAIMNFGFAMATGTPWVNCETPRKGGFLFVSMESADASVNIVHGLAAQHAGIIDRNVDAPFRIHAEPLSLYDKNGKSTANEAKITRLAKDIEKETGTRCDLIVLDTLSRVLLGGNENLAGDLAIVSAAAERIKDATGAAVIILHHAKKDGEDFRGSGAILGNFEGLIQAKRTGDVGELVLERLKGVRAGASIRYRSTEIEIGKYADGTALTTFVLRPYDGPDMKVDENAPDLGPPPAGGEVENEEFTMDKEQQRLFEAVSAIGRPFTTDEAVEAYNRNFGRKWPLKRTKIRGLLVELLGLRVGQAGEASKSRRWFVLKDDDALEPEAADSLPPRETEDATVEALLDAAADFDVVGLGFRQGQLRDELDKLRAREGLRPIPEKRFAAAFALAQARGWIVYSAGAGRAKSLLEFVVAPDFEKSPPDF